MLTDYINTVVAGVGSVLHSIFMVSSSRHYWLFMVSYLVIALGIYCLYRQRSDQGSFLKFLFPSKIYTHPSAIMDLKIWVVVVLVVNAGLFGLLYTVVGYVSGAIGQLFDLLGAGWQAERTAESPTVGDRIVYTVVITCCIDFGFFIMHYCQHKISWLWAFHKVHHSAEVLTPLTANRHHPVDYTLGAATAILLGAIGTVVFSRLYGAELDIYTVLNTSAIHFFYYMSANARHSHIWVSFGPWLSMIFVSPAMHQIHHSIDDRHFDKNFGFVFSFWDRLFGCRYIPSQQETIAVGLRPGERGYNGFIDSMYRPFVDCFEGIRSTRKWRRYSTP